MAGTPMRSASGSCGTNCMPSALPAIITELTHLVGRDTAPRSRHCTSGGPSRRWFSSQSSSAGQPLLAAQAASSRKGTVGSTGSMAPMAPSSRLTSARARHSRVAMRRRSSTRSEGDAVTGSSSDIKSASSACVSSADSYQNNSINAPDAILPTARRGGHGRQPGARGARRR